jgi:hypothetical protein
LSPYQHGANGIELEVKKSLGNQGEKGFLNKLSLVCNASLIKSKVDMGVVTSQERIRSLQGQSPYVINGGLFYNDLPKNLNITMMYNVFGKRIFMVGDALFPSIYEMPRHVLDFTLSKKISSKILPKFSYPKYLDFLSC